jgi:peroxiredoxin
MQQVVDLQDSKEFTSLGIELLSISPDPIDFWKSEADKYEIELPVLSDPGNVVADRYGVMKWAVGAEPGHTFVLVDEAGEVAWLRDYGAPENGGLMYVEPDELISQLQRSLACPRGLWCTVIR